MAGSIVFIDSEVRISDKKIADLGAVKSLMPHFCADIISYTMICAICGHCWRSLFLRNRSIPFIFLHYCFRSGPITRC